MRWVFYALFLFNIGFFAFGFFVINPNAELQLIEPSPIAQSQDRNKVQLLSERNDIRSDAQELGSNEITGITIEEPRQNPVEETAERFETNAKRAKCYRIGPFDNKTAAESHQLKIGFNDGLVRIDEQPESIDTTYWVYIPPAYTKEEALTTLRSLQVSGVDSFVVLKGQFMHAVSLGLFKRPESAEALKNSVAALGYQVEIEKQELVRNSFWLYLKATEIEQQKSIETTAQVGPNLSVFSCEMFAQDKLFP